MTEFKIGDQVRRKGDAAHWTGRIVHIEDNVAMVKYGVADNRMIKLTELLPVEQPKPEPFKPGWYKIRYRPANNFVYYIQDELDGKLVYTAAYNPVSGEMEGSPSFPILIGKVLLNHRRGDLVRMKFTEE